MLELLLWVGWAWLLAGAVETIESIGLVDGAGRAMRSVAALAVGTVAHRVNLEAEDWEERVGTVLLCVGGAALELWLAVWEMDEPEAARMWPPVYFLGASCALVWPIIMVRLRRG